MKQRHIAILVFEDVNLLDVAGPIQVFAQANHVDANVSVDYKTISVSKNGGLVKSSSGISIDTVSLDSFEITSDDTVIIAGGYGVHQVLADDGLVDWVRRLVNRGCRISSVCTGAYLLAQAGLLDQKKATTHWKNIEHFQSYFPKVCVEHDAIYVKDQGVWSSAGITAGIDLALAMLAEDIGYKASLETARELVMYIKRPGGQAQFSETLHLQMKDEQGVFDDLHFWINDNLSIDLSVERLADFMNMSSRTFYRSYKKITGLTPAKYVEKTRAEFVKGKLEHNSANLSVIINQSGFMNEERMRRAFVKYFGVSPSEYRKRFAIPQY